MKIQTFTFSLLVALMACALPPAFAQDSEPTLPSTEETAVVEPEAPASQEVEINEDNYRQFMELKDAMRQRDIIPENVFKPGSGLQKLDKLPEASQKHLRNQLREIIVQGDPWQPGDEETDYPYTPSPAASTDPSLEKQEQEAWGELVDSYHDRESQIYENSSGSQAARGSEQGSSNNSENGSGATGQPGQSGESGQAQQAGQEGSPQQNNPDQSDTEGTYSLNGSSDSSGNSTAGVSQNAMEFLQGLGTGGSNPQGTSNGVDTEGPAQGNSPTPSQSQTQGQTQAQTDQNGSAETPSGAIDSNPSQTARDSGSNSTAGTSQNAMEFLMGNTGQAEETTDGASGNSENMNSASESASNASDDAEPTDQQFTQQDAQSEEESTAGASQNALEYLMEESTQVDDDINNQVDTNQSEGTLTIQELLNARGVNNTAVTLPSSSVIDEEQPLEETKPDKDGDG